MCRIIKNVAGAAEAEQRLVSTMINIERGALTVGDRGEPLPAPHAAYPTLEVKPVTKRGLPTVYHLKPTVGIVFYTAGTGFHIPSFVARLRTGLAKHGYEHLIAYRTTAITPCATIKKIPDLQADTTIIGPRKPYKKGKIDSSAGLPARLMLFTPPLHEELPTHVSYRAGFTWVFMSIGAIVDMQMVGGAPALNALMASALYDDAGLIRLENDAIIHKLSSTDIITPALPPAIQKAVDFGFNSTVVVVTRKGATRTLELSGSVPIDDAGITRVVGEVPWSTLKTCNEEAKDMSCPMCMAPLWGEVYAIVDPHMPRGNELDGTWQFTPFDGIPPGASILEGRSVVVCKYCARRLCAGLPGHLQCTVVRTRVACTHDQAWEKSRHKFLLALTQAGTAGVTPIPDMSGWFTVGVAGSEFVLRPAGPGAYSCTAIPQISARPILNIPNLSVQT